MLDLFCEEKTLRTVQSYYWNEQFIAERKRRNHLTSRPPFKGTGLEIELTKHTVSS